MLLKGKLAHHRSLKKLKKLGHDLVKCWTAFKSVLPGEDLSQHDDVITLLNEFEDLRYPDDLLKFGAVIIMGFVTRADIGSPSPGTVEPTYTLSVTDLDALMDRLFKLCGINPEAYMKFYGDALEIVERHNVSCKGWFAQREASRQSD